LFPAGPGEESSGKTLRIDVFRIRFLLYFDQEFSHLQGFNQGWRMSRNTARAMDEPKAREAIN
jgi:hypothetical protein